jgi:hypothetical protein
MDAKNKTTVTTKLWRMLSLQNDYNKEMCMKRFTIALAGLALVTTAQAADTTDFKWNAEMRLRYTNDTAYSFQKEIQNEAGATNPGNGQGAIPDQSMGRNYNSFAQRVKLGLGMTRGESLSGYLSTINHSYWGDTANRTAAGDYTYGNPNAPGATAARNNDFVLNEAWGWWKANDMVSVKFGRSTMEIAGGAVAGPNDWQPIPNVFDGIWSMWDFEPVSVKMFGLKLRDTNVDGAAGTSTPAAGQTSGPSAGATNAIGQRDDSESVLYGVVAGVKNLPEFLKVAEVHLMQVNDETTTTYLPNGQTAANQAVITNTDRAEMLRYGLIVSGDMSNVDYRLIGDFYTGKKKADGTLGGTSATANTFARDQALSGSMVDLNVGYTLPEIMMLRIGANYHMDSGGEVTNTDNKTYKPFAYSAHEFGGDMDVMTWGNLTYWGLNVAVKPMDDLDVKLSYWDYSRTSERDGVTVNGFNQGAETNGTTTATNNTRHAGTQAGTSNKIGSEIDFTVTKTYGENFSIWALYGVFTPGEFIKGNPAGARDDAHTRMQVQAKLTF